MVSEGVVLHAGRVLGQEGTVLGGVGLCGEELLKWQTGRQSAQLGPEVCTSPSQVPPPSDSK